MTIDNPGDVHLPPTVPAFHFEVSQSGTCSLIAQLVLARSWCIIGMGLRCVSMLALPSSPISMSPREYLGQPHLGRQAPVAHQLHPGGFASCGNGAPSHSRRPI